MSRRAVGFAVVSPTAVSDPVPTVADAEAWARAHLGDGWFAVVVAPASAAAVASARAQLAAARRAYDVAVRLAWAEAAAEAAARAWLADPLASVPPGMPS